MNFVSKFVIHENSLGSFTCRKPGTWVILFYFPSEGRDTEELGKYFGRIQGMLETYADTKTVTNKMVHRRVLSQCLGPFSLRVNLVAGF